MKVKQLFLVLLACGLSLAVTAQRHGGAVVKNPDESNYVIKGEMGSSMRDGSPVFMLESVISKNISFKSQSVFYGTYDEETERVSFSFADASTTHPNKFNDGLILWTWDKNSQAWKRDAEKTENRVVFERTKIMSVMLVLDCSGSMSEDGSPNFSMMQRSAISFLDSLYRYASETGNIRVGLVGFNTTKYADEHAYAPMALNSQNYAFLRNKINGLRSVENAGTAFYYSVDKAVSMLKEDYNNIDHSKFNGATVVAFTDGKDNLSKDFSKGITNLDGYLNYMQNSYCNHSIGGKKVQSWVTAFRGKNVDIEEWESMLYDMKNVFGCAGNDEEPVITIREMNELTQIFRRISSNLIMRNMVLTCQVPSGISGPVAWTIPEYERRVAPAPVVVEEKPKGKRSLWFGLGLELGEASCDYYDGYGSSLYFAMSLDFAISINNTIAVGPSVSLGADVDYESLHAMLGPMAKITFDNNTAVLASMRMGMMCDLFTTELRAGYKFKKSFFLTGALNYNEVGVGAGIGFGWGFGGKIK